MDVALSNRHQTVRLSAFQRGMGFTVMGVRVADGTVDKNGVWPSVFVQAANIALPTGFLLVVGVIAFFLNAPIIALIALGLALIFARKAVMGAGQMSLAC